jgi:hypothetical protein
VDLLHLEGSYMDNDSGFRFKDFHSEWKSSPNIEELLKKRDRVTERIEDEDSNHIEPTSKFLKHFKEDEFLHSSTKPHLEIQTSQYEEVSEGYIELERSLTISESVKIYLKPRLTERYHSVDSGSDTSSFSFLREEGLSSTESKDTSSQGNNFIGVLIWFVIIILILSLL